MLYIRSLTFRIYNIVSFVPHSNYKYLFSSNYLLFILKVPWGIQRWIWHGHDLHLASSFVEETMYETLILQRNMHSYNALGVYLYELICLRTYFLTGWEWKEYCYTNAWGTEENKALEGSLLVDYLLIPGADFESLWRSRLQKEAKGNIFKRLREFGTK